MPKSLPNLNPVKAHAARKARAKPAVALPPDFLAFLRGHIVVSHSGSFLPWSAVGHEYLLEPLTLPSPWKAIQKSTQLGVSTGVIAVCFHAAGFHGWTVGYHLPTDKHCTDFVKLHIDPLINRDATLARLVVEGTWDDGLSEWARGRHKGSDTTLKRIGRGWNLFQGCENPNDVISFPFDLAVSDEFDRLRTAIAAQVQERMLHSTVGHEIKLSRPELPGHGINREFESGDQRLWLLRCTRGHWTNLEDTFPSCLVNLQRVGWAFRCPQCGGKLPYIEGRAEGSAQYVATHPDRELTSWRISQLYGPTTKPAAVAKRWAAAQDDHDILESFTRAILGKPFAGDRQPVSQDVFQAACNPEVKLALAEPFLPPPSEGRGAGGVGIYPGIDVGKRFLHLTLLADLGALGLQTFWHERLGWGELEALLSRIPFRFLVIDALPEHTQSTLLCRKFFRQSAICYFPQGVQQTIFGVEGDGGVNEGELDIRSPEAVIYFKTNRDNLIDAMCSKVIAGKLRFPSLKFAETVLVGRHFQNLVKVLEGEPPRWKFQTAVENHYGFSTAYAYLAWEMAHRLHLGPAQPIGNRALSIPRTEDPFQW